MRKGLITGLLLLALLLLFSSVLAAITQPRPVTVVRVEGVIAPNTSEFLLYALKEANKSNSQALVIELDTPGGLDLAMRSIVKEFLASPIPIIVYVSPSGARAASAGVFLTMAAHIAAMAPGTNIGAAHPVSIGGQMDKEMAKKVTNDAAAYIRALAEKRGRNPQWAEDAVRRSVSVTEKDALRLRIIDLVSEKLENLLQEVDGWEVVTLTGKVSLRTKGAPIQRIEMTFRDKVLKIISDPTIAYILLILGFYGLLYELANPGAILPGVLGAIFLILAFFAFQSLPINYAGLLLILLALILFILDIKVQSHGVLTVGGIISMILGSLMLIESPAPFFQISLVTIISAAMATAAFFFFVVAAGLKAQRRKPTTGREGLLGEKGIARSRLAPEGQIFVRGEIWSAISEEVVEPGEKVVVDGVSGLKLKVKKVQQGAIEGEPSVPKISQPGQG